MSHYHKDAAICENSKLGCFPCTECRCVFLPASIAANDSLKQHAECFSQGPKSKSNSNCKCAQSGLCMQTFQCVSCHRSVRRQRLRKDNGGPENNRSPGRSLGRPPVNGLVLQGLQSQAAFQLARELNLNVAMENMGAQLVK